LEVVEDTSRMIKMAELIADELEENPPPDLPGHEVTGGAEFLRWLAEGHFTFLGYRRYELIGAAAGDGPALRGGRGWGLRAARTRAGCGPGMTVTVSARRSWRCARNCWC